MEQETTLRHNRTGGVAAVRLGSVRLAAGPVVIARLDEGAAAGAGVHMVVDIHGAIWARRTELPAAPAPGQ